MSATVTLRRPVKAHGDEVGELTLREPTTKDIMEIGLPTLLVPSGDGQAVGVEIRQKVVGRFISRLAQIPMSSVESLHPADFSRCSAVVMGFFEMSDGEETNAPSSDSPETSST